MPTLKQKRLMLNIYKNESNAKRAVTMKSKNGGEYFYLQLDDGWFGLWEVKPVLGITKELMA